MAGIAEGTAPPASSCDAGRHAPPPDALSKGKEVGTDAGGKGKERRRGRPVARPNRRSVDSGSKFKFYLNLNSINFYINFV
jgi:hypothetical protein